MTWMRTKTQILTLILFVFVFLSFAASSLPAQSSNDVDSAAINQRVSEFTAAFNMHDAHACAVLFAEDADFTTVTGNFTHGRKDIEDLMAALFTGVLRAAQRTNSVKRIRYLTPEVASVVGEWEVTGVKLPNGSERSQKGLLVMTMTKQKGNWFITVFHEPMLSQVETPAK